MEQAFAKLQSVGKTDVENLVKWMKESNVIGATKEHEDMIRSLFNDIPDKANITLDQFEGVLNKLAGDLKTNFEVIAKQLGDNIPKVLQDAMGGAARTLMDNLRTKTDDKSGSASKLESKSGSASKLESKSESETILESKSESEPES